MASIVLCGGRLRYCAIITDMPAPTNERQAWERELREELPTVLADHQRELAATPAENRDRRER